LAGATLSKDVSARIATDSMSLGFQGFRHTGYTPAPSHRTGASHLQARLGGSEDGSDKGSHLRPVDRAARVPWAQHVDLSLSSAAALPATSSFLPVPSAQLDQQEGLGGGANRDLLAAGLGWGTANVTSQAQPVPGAAQEGTKSTAADGTDAAPKSNSLQFLDEELHSTHVPVEALDLDLDVEIIEEGLDASQATEHTSQTSAREAALSADPPSLTQAMSLGLVADAGAPMDGPHRLSQLSLASWHSDHAVVLHRLLSPEADESALPASMSASTWGSPDTLRDALAQMDAVTSTWVYQRIEPLVELFGQPVLFALHSPEWTRRAQALTHISRCLTTQESFLLPRRGPRGPRPSAAVTPDVTKELAEQEAYEATLLSFRAHVYIVATVLQDPSLTVYQSALGLASLVLHKFSSRVPPRELLNWMSPLLAAALPNCGHRLALRRRLSASFVLSLASCAQFGFLWVAARLLTGLEETKACSWRGLLARLALMQHLLLGFGLHPDSALAIDCLMRWCSLLLQHRDAYVRNAAIALVWTLNRVDAPAVEPFLKEIAPMMMPRLETTDPDGESGWFTSRGGVGGVGYGGLRLDTAASPTASAGHGITAIHSPPAGRDLAQKALNRVGSAASMSGTRGPVVHSPLASGAGSPGGAVLKTYDFSKVSGSVVGSLKWSL
jgi:hypothetical protein